MRRLITARMLTDFGMPEIQAMLSQHMPQLGQALLHRGCSGRVLHIESDVDPTVGHVDLYIQRTQFLGMQAYARLLDFLATEPGNLLCKLLSESVASDRRRQRQRMHG